MAIVRKNVEECVRLLKKDPSYKKLKETFNSVSLFNIPKKELLIEIEETHKLRSVRSLSVRDPDFVDRLIQTNIKEQATRSRLVEIMMVCSQITSRLEMAIDALKTHLLLTYSDSLKGFRTKEERQQIINIVLKSYLKYIREVQEVRNQAEIVISDIDKAAWSLKLTVSALELASRRET